MYHNGGLLSLDYQDSDPGSILPSDDMDDSLLLQGVQQTSMNSTPNRNHQYPLFEGGNYSELSMSPMIGSSGTNLHPTFFANMAYPAQFSWPDPLRVAGQLPTCSRMSGNLIDNVHKQSHRKNPILCPVNYCPQSKKVHRSKRDLRRHIWIKHKDYAIEQKVPVESKTCDLCGMVSRKDNLKRHLKKIHGRG